MAYMLILLLKKMWVAFAFATATHIFSAKLPVNQTLYLLLTTNELVKHCFEQPVPDVKKNPNKPYLFLMCPKTHNHIFLFGLDDGDLVFYVPFKPIYVISRRWKGDNERLSAMECQTIMSWIPSIVGFQPDLPKQISKTKTWGDYLHELLKPTVKLQWLPTSTACLTWLVRTRFLVPRKFIQ